MLVCVEKCWGGARERDPVTDAALLSQPAAVRRAAVSAALRPCDGAPTPHSLTPGPCRVAVAQKYEKQISAGAGIKRGAAERVQRGPTACRLGGRRHMPPAKASQPGQRSRRPKHEQNVRRHQSTWTQGRGGETGRGLGCEQAALERGCSLALADALAHPLRGAGKLGTLQTRCIHVPTLTLRKMRRTKARAPR